MKIKTRSSVLGSRRASKDVDHHHRQWQFVLCRCCNRYWLAGFVASGLMRSIVCRSSRPRIS